jgi:hypothetical protein
MVASTRADSPAADKLSEETAGTLASLRVF